MNKRGILLLIQGLILVLFLSKGIIAGKIVGVSPGNMYFKDVLRGGYAERYLTVTIDSEEEIEVFMTPRGEISNWFEFKENFTTSKNNPGRVLLKVLPPSDIPNGNYTGFLRVETKALGQATGEGRATGIVKAVIDVAITIEVTDIEILKCRAKSFNVNSVEKGDDLIFNANVLNQGNIRLKPNFKVDIWDQEQIMIVKSVEKSGKEILPTKEESISFGVSTDDLELDQYWVEIHATDCFASETLTFDILEEGVLKAEGILFKIFGRVWTDVGETFPIIAHFKNTGEKSIDAQFKGKITFNGKIIQILESEKTTVPISGVTNFTFYTTPKKAGKYIASGRVFYDKKRTFESSTIINVRQKEFGLKQILINVSYLLLMILIGFLIYKIKKEKRRYQRK